MASTENTELPLTETQDVHSLVARAISKCRAVKRTIAEESMTTMTGATCSNFDHNNSDDEDDDDEINDVGHINDNNGDNSNCGGGSSNGGDGAVGVSLKRSASKHSISDEELSSPKKIKFDDCFALQVQSTLPFFLKSLGIIYKPGDKFFKLTKWGSRVETVWPISEKYCDILQSMNQMAWISVFMECLMNIMCSSGLQINLGYVVTPNYLNMYFDPSVTPSCRYFKQNYTDEFRCDSVVNFAVLGGKIESRVVTARERQFQVCELLLSKEDSLRFKQNKISQTTFENQKINKLNIVLAGRCPIFKYSETAGKYIATDEMQIKDLPASVEPVLTLFTIKNIKRSTTTKYKVTDFLNVTISITMMICKY